jgi:AcrR family transcriptional regulator
VAAAVKLADREGLEAVSMERVAGELGVSTMGLYRHVRGKAELLESMLDAAIGPPPALRGAGWRERLASFARALFRGFLRRPWTLAATGSLRLMGPNELAWLEAALGALADTELSRRERQAACLAVITQVRGFAQFAARDGRMTAAQWESRMASVLAPHASRFPEVTALLAEASPRHDPLTFALDCLLDGIERAIARPRRTRR